MRILILEAKFVRKKCALYTGKYGMCFWVDCWKLAFIAIKDQDLPSQVSEGFDVVFLI